MAITLLVTPKEVKAQSQLSGQIDSEKLEIPIRITQDLKIRTILGAALYTRINDLFVAGTRSITLEPYKTLFYDHIKTTLILYVAAKYTLQTPLEVSNGGSSTYSPNNGSAAARADIVSQAKNIENDAETYAGLMVKYLKANDSIFPEYTEIIEGEAKADDDVYFSGMEMSDGRDEIEYLDRTGKWV